MPDKEKAPEPDGSGAFFVTSGISSGAGDFGCRWATATTTGLFLQLGTGNIVCRGI